MPKQYEQFVSSNETYTLRPAEGQMIFALRLLGDKRIIRSDRWETFTNVKLYPDWLLTDIRLHKRDRWDMSNGKVTGD